MKSQMPLVKIISCLKRDFLPEAARDLICSKRLLCVLSQSHRLYISHVKNVFDTPGNSPPYFLLAENVKKFVVSSDQGAFITQDLKLWTFNKNHKVKPELSNIVDVARGKHHIICLDKFGRVYGKGTGKLGQLNGHLKVKSWTFLDSGYQSVYAGLNSTFLKTRKQDLVTWCPSSTTQTHCQIPELIFALDHQRPYVQRSEYIRSYNIKQIVNSPKSNLMILGYPKDKVDAGIKRLMRTAKSHEDRAKLNFKDISDVVDFTNFSEILTIYRSDVMTVLEVLDEKYGMRCEFVTAAISHGFDINSLLRLKSGLTTLLIDNIGNLEFTRFLLTLGADPNLVSEEDEGVLDRLLLTVCDIELTQKILALLKQYQSKYWLRVGVRTNAAAHYTDEFLKQFIDRE